MKDFTENLKKMISSGVDDHAIAEAAKVAADQLVESYPGGIPENVIVDVSVDINYTDQSHNAKKFIGENRTIVCSKDRIVRELQERVKGGEMLEEDINDYGHPRKVFRPMKAA